MYSNILHHTNPEKYIKMDEKMKHITLDQLTSMFDKYLEENPEVWHYFAVDSFLSMLSDFIF